ncbi:hypothetical protein ACOSQ3_004850 [Xanthoceras sorbifolium]
MIKAKLGWFIDQSSNLGLKEKVFSQSVIGSDEIPDPSIGSSTSVVGDRSSPIIVDEYYVEKKLPKRPVTRSTRKSKLPALAADSSGAAASESMFFFLGVSLYCHRQIWIFVGLLAIYGWLLFSLAPIFRAVLIWNERLILSLKMKGEIAILAIAKYRGENILSPTRMKKAGLADFPAPSGKRAKQNPSSLKRKLDNLDDNEEWPRSYLLGAAASRMKSPEASPTGKGLSSVARSSQTRSGKRKTSTLTLDDAIEPIRTLIRK